MGESSSLVVQDYVHQQYYDLFLLIFPNLSKLKPPTNPKQPANMDETLWTMGYLHIFTVSSGEFTGFLDHQQYVEEIFP